MFWNRLSWHNYVSIWQNDFCWHSRVQPQLFLYVKEHNCSYQISLSLPPLSRTHTCTHTHAYTVPQLYSSYNSVLLLCMQEVNAGCEGVSEIGWCKPGKMWSHLLLHPKRDYNTYEITWKKKYIDIFFQKRFHNFVLKMFALRSLMAYFKISWKEELVSLYSQEFVLK